MNSTLGLLPAAERNPASIITSSVANLSIVGILFLIGSTAVHRMATVKYTETTLYMPEMRPLPEIKIPPLAAAPVRAPVPAQAHSIPAPIVLATKIWIQRPQLTPEPANMTLPDEQSPTVATAKSTPRIVLAPQPKLAFAIPQAQTIQHPEGTVSPIRMGTGEVQNSAFHQSVAAAGIGAFQSSRSGVGMSQSVAPAGMGRMQQARADIPNGQVSAAAFPKTVAVAPLYAAQPAAAPAMTPIEVLAGPRPQYTDEARQLRLQGSVVLHVSVTADGRIKVLSVVHGLGHGLDEAAIKAVEQYRVKPATRRGIPVEQTTNITVTFQLA